MSGQATMPVLDGDGGWLELALQCHQALIGAPSPMQANQPWYPTVIFPTTSPGPLAADAGPASAVVAAPAAPVAVAAAAARRKTRRVTPIWTPPIGGQLPPPHGDGGIGSGPEVWCGGS